MISAEFIKIFSANYIVKKIVWVTQIIKSSFTNSTPGFMLKSPQVTWLIAFCKEIVGHDKEKILKLEMQ